MDAAALLTGLIQSGNPAAALEALSKMPALGNLQELSKLANMPGIRDAATNPMMARAACKGQDGMVETGKLRRAGGDLTTWPAHPCDPPHLSAVPPGTYSTCE